MSKERLEKIEEIDEEVSNGFALEDLDLNTMTVVNRQHFEWLKEQAKQNNDYREVLDRISNHDVYKIDITAAGKMADRALEGDPHESI